MSRILRSAAAVVIAAVLASSPVLIHDADAQFRKRVVMYGGMTAPGTTGATFNTSFPGSPIGIADNGDVFFKAYLEGGDTQPGVNDTGLWFTRDDELMLLARLGDPAPGLTGFTYVDFINEYIDLDGGIAFMAQVSDGSAIHHAIFFEAGGAATLKVTRGDEVELGITIFSTSLQVHAVIGGKAVFTCGVDGAGVTGADNVGLVLYDDDGPGNLSFVAREGDAMPGVAGGYTFQGSFSSFNSAGSFSDAGGFVFNAEGRNISTGDEIGVLYRYNAGTLTPIEISNPNENLLVFADTRQNGAGQTALEAYASFPSTRAIYRENLQATALVTEGDAADGSGGDTYSNFVDFALPDNNRVAVHGEVSDGRLGIWYESALGPTLRSVAIVGGEVPGFPGYEFFRVNNMSVGKSGLIAFHDLVFNPTTTDEFVGLWVGSDAPSLAMRTGDTIELAPGDTRTVDGVEIGNQSSKTRTGTDGQPAVINTDNQMIVHVTFSDFSGAIVVLSSGLVVNATGDSSDLTAGDGVCDTGAVVDRNGTDEPECTLRAAIEEANAAEGRDDIAFDIPGSGPWRIQPQSQLPDLVDEVSIKASVGSSGGIAARKRARYNPALRRYRRRLRLSSTVQTPVPGQTALRLL